MSTAVLVDDIDQHRVRFGLQPICHVLRESRMQIAPSTYDADRTRETRRTRGPSTRAPLTSSG